MPCTNPVDAPAVDESSPATPDPITVGPRRPFENPSIPVVTASRQAGETPTVIERPPPLPGTPEPADDPGALPARLRRPVASLLAIIARRDASLKASASKGGVKFDLPLTREEMADYLGLTLETVSRQMSGLKRDGVIELEGKRHVIVGNLDRLLEETGDDSDGGALV